jgi:hypothetical protein
MNAFNEANGMPSLAKDSNVYSGFVAQDVYKLAKSLDYDFSGVKVPENEETQMYGVRYAEFVVPLVQSTQELNQKVDDQQAQIEKQKELLAAQQDLIQNYDMTMADYAEALKKLQDELKSLEAKVATQSGLEASTDND